MQGSARVKGLFFIHDGVLHTMHSVIKRDGIKSSFFRICFLEALW